MNTLLLRTSLLAVGFAIALPVVRATTQDAPHASAAAAKSAASSPKIPPATATIGFASDEDPIVLARRQAASDAHAADVARRAEIEAQLLADPLTRPLGELIGKNLDVPRAKLAATPEDIAAFKALYDDPERGVDFATRALAILPRDGFGFERSAVLAGLDSLIDRGQEASVVPVMLDELARTTVGDPENGSLDLGLPQIAQRSLLRARSVGDAEIAAATARAIAANEHPTVASALARQLVAQRPTAAQLLRDELARIDFPADALAWKDVNDEQ